MTRHASVEQQTHELHWQILGARRRARYFRTHERRCVICGRARREATLFRKARRVELHHLHYGYQTSYEPDDVLVALCRYHHQLVHNKHRVHREPWPYLRRLPHITNRTIRCGRRWRRLIRTLPEWNR